MEDLHLKAGLVYSGKNADGEDEYVGTRQQWDMYENLASECPECSAPAGQHENWCIKCE